MSITVEGLCLAKQKKNLFFDQGEYVVRDDIKFLIPICFKGQTEMKFKLLVRQVREPTTPIILIRSIM